MSSRTDFRGVFCSARGKGKIGRDNQSKSHMQRQKKWKCTLLVVVEERRWHGEPSVVLEERVKLEESTEVTYKDSEAEDTEA